MPKSICDKTTAKNLSPKSVVVRQNNVSLYKYVQVIFLELKTIIAGERINLSVARTENYPN